MRLLLDEHFPPKAAQELRRRGGDVVAVGEIATLHGLSDDEIFVRARSDRRAVVTRDFSGFSRLLRDAAVTETEHFGVVFVSRTLWRSARDLGRLIAAVELFLQRNPADDALASGAAWLGRP